MEGLELRLQKLEEKGAAANAATPPRAARRNTGGASSISASTRLPPRDYGAHSWCPRLVHVQGFAP